MNRFTSVLVIIGVAAMGILPATGTTVEPPLPAGDFLPGSVIVAFESADFLKSNDALAELADRFGVTAAVSLDPSGKSPLASTYELQFNPEIPVADAVAAFGAIPGVAYAEPNLLYRPAVLFQNPPNDPLYAGAWHMSKINAMGGWLVSWGSPSIPIAIIDTGVKWDHPDLAANIWVNADEIPGNGIDDDANGFIDDVRGWDFVNTVGVSCANAIPLGEDCLTPDNNPMDHYGHGTAVAGVAAAVTDNGIGVAGVGRLNSIMALRAGYTTANASGIVTGAVLSASAISSSIMYAANNGARVINMSFGGGFSTSVQNAMNFAASQGVVLVAGAGNGDTSSSAAAFPGNAANAIGVGATEQNDQKAYLSNYGAWVDVAAPGVQISTTIPPFAPVGGDPDGDGYGQLDGTSMAAPIVSGIAGLILAKNPSMTADQARTLIQSGVDPLATSQHLGTGRVNVRKALTLGISGFNPPVALLSANLDNTNSMGAPVVVSGIASGPNFTNFRVDVGAGVNPAQWTTFIPVTTTPVVNGLLGFLDPAALGLANGVYTIRLIVNSGAKAFRDDTTLNVN